MSKKGKLKRLNRQIELLKNFEGDFYQEKKVGENWYIKSFNGSTERWQVSIYSEQSFGKYKAYTQAKIYNNEFERKMI